MPPAPESQTHADLFVFAMPQNSQHHIFGIRHYVAMNLMEIQNRCAINGDDDVTFFYSRSGRWRMRKCANDLHGWFIA